MKTYHPMKFGKWRIFMNKRAIRKQYMSDYPAFAIAKSSINIIILTPIFGMTIHKSR